MKVHWLEDPEQHDYQAAYNYLSLLLDPPEAARVRDDLEDFTVTATVGKAKDILRASRLPVLPADEHHVRKDLGKISDGEALSPVLLLQGNLYEDRPVVIADGYHRVCAVYHADPDADIRGRIG